MPRTVKTDASHLGAESAPERDDPADMRAATPVDAPMATVMPLGHMATLRPTGALGTREQIQQELDSIAAACRMFYMKQPDQVMREISAYSARLTELAVLLHREEAYDRQYTRVRTQQVERWLVDLDRQFKIASRMVEVARQDLELLR